LSGDCKMRTKAANAIAPMNPPKGAACSANTLTDFGAKQERGSPVCYFTVREVDSVKPAGGFPLSSVGGWLNNECRQPTARCGPSGCSPAWEPS
jgi:hypothetical protein